jgi:glyoxylase I family protein
VKFNKIDHVAIICSDYKKSKEFYVEKLGFKVIDEVYREERDSYKLDLEVGGIYQIELFSFPNPPKRLGLPDSKEACGLRHLAFEVDDIEKTKIELEEMGIGVEKIREYKGRKYTFFKDPDGLPLEIYEK